MGQRSPAVRSSHARRLFRECGVLSACDGRIRRAPLDVGFTLIELMVTVAIIGILAAIAYPSYIQYIVRGNRAAAEAFLLEVSTVQERFLVDTRAYATTLAALGYPSVPSAVSSNYQVTVAVVAGPPQGYVLTAAPLAGQASNDAACGTLTLTGTGDKAASGGGTNCWK